MKFAIFGNTYQAKKSSHAENLFRLLAQHQAQLCVCREFYNFHDFRPTPQHSARRIVRR